MKEWIIANGLTRREFVKASLMGTAVVAFSSMGLPADVSAQAKGPFALPPLPYAEDALAPVISARTIGFHYGKHHRAYVDNLNGLVKNTPYEKMSLEEVVKASAVDPWSGGHFQQRRTGLESHLLLERHEARGRRQAGR